MGGFLAEQGTGVSFDELVAQVGANLTATFSRPAPPKEVNIVALAFPPAMIPVHKIEEDGSMTVRGERALNTTTIGRNVSLSSLASAASLVLPSGLTTSGLPVGLEFDALPGADRQLLGLGVSLQRTLASIQAPPVELG
jgi:mandelamide amidase